jgi:HTH-type transcriptional regulator / antitoxin HigA
MLDGHRVWRQEPCFIGDGQGRRDTLAYIRHQLLAAEVGCNPSSAGREDAAELEEFTLREDGRRRTINPHKQTISADFHDRHEMQAQQDNNRQSVESRLAGGTMAAANATWIMHPGFYLKEEMEARGWSQRDLAFIIGCPEQALNLILAGKRGISPDMAKALGEAFDVDPQFFANLQIAYDMAHARNPYAGTAKRREMQNTYPVREMIRRGWIQPSDPVMLESQLVRFFQAPSPESIPYMAHAAKKTSYEEREIPPAQLAWLFRVRHVAMSIPAQRYSEKALRSALHDFEQLMFSPELVRHVPKLLMECGVRYILVEKLPSAKIDGVCFWLDDASPVIGMSTQHDRIDNFWFVLRHEIEHVLQGHGREEEKIDTDLDGSGSDPLDEEERIANDAAAEFCAPTSRLNSFLARKHPYYYEKDVVAFSRLINRHPGIVVGQVRKRLNRWDYLTRYLVKVRQFVLPASTADGWGQVVPISL